MGAERARPAGAGGPDSVRRAGVRADHGGGDRQVRGLTERTFFRHFADKREVLFYGSDALLDLLVQAVAGAPPAAGPIDAVSAALQAVGAVIQETPEPARLRYAVVSVNQELRERELAKLAEFAAAMAAALRDRGVPELAASLAAETGTAVYRVTFARWIAGQAQPDLGDLPELLRESMAELGDVFTDRLLSFPKS
jgi:AcrR family transcriptional regulator